MIWLPKIIFCDVLDYTSFYESLFMKMNGMSRALNSGNMYCLQLFMKHHGDWLETPWRSPDVTVMKE